MTNVEENVWKDIIGYEGHYQISNHGQIKSIRRSGIKVGETKLSDKIRRISSKGRYAQIVLCKDCVTKTFLIHRLVAIAFIDNPDNLPQVNHKDSNKRNNYYKNLEWTDHNGNMKHGVENELFLRGEKNPKAILSDADVEKIRTELMHIPTDVLARQFNVLYANIWDIKNNRSRVWK